MSRQEQIEEIYTLIMQLASGNLTHRGKIFGVGNELDAVLEGVNMLGEELAKSTVNVGYLKNIYKGIVDMLFIVDFDYRIIEINESVTRVLGYQKQELIGRKLDEIFSRRRLGLDLIAEEIRRSGYFEGIESSLIHKNGHQVMVVKSGAALVGRHDDEKSIQIIAKDITALKNIEKALVEKNHQLNTLLYRTSHDLKGPLASLTGIVTQMEGMLDTDPQSLVEYLDLLRQGISKLSRVLNDMQVLGNLTKEEEDGQFYTFEEIIDQTVKNIAHKPYFEEGILERDIIDDQSLRINNKSMTTVILTNLIDNAYQFGKPRQVGEPSRIKVKIRNMDRQLLLSVTDNGQGVRKDMQGRIFDMFYRGHSKSKGTGMGLFIVKSAVEYKGGSIKVFSDGKQGSCFLVRIPG